jgi:acyl-CoA hydrolase
MPSRDRLRNMEQPHTLEPVIQLNEVFPSHTNARDTLFGGRLMSIMDTAAGMAASKYAHQQFVTISVDSLKFRRPAYQGDVIRTTSKVVWTSPHTAGVHVISCRLSRSEWVGEEICSGFFFMVAVDKNMKPSKIPQFTPMNDEEQNMWNAAQKAREMM